MLGKILLETIYVLSKLVLLCSGFFWLSIAIYNIAGRGESHGMAIAMELAFGLASCVAVSAKWSA
jgi:hypothetical protein